MPAASCSLATLAQHHRRRIASVELLEKGRWPFSRISRPAAFGDIAVQMQELGPVSFGQGRQRLEGIRCVQLFASSKGRVHLGQIAVLGAAAGGGQRGLDRPEAAGELGVGHAQGLFGVDVQMP